MAEDFYRVHESKPFYEDLCNYLSSGPIIVMILEKESAVIVELPIGQLKNHDLARALYITNNAFIKLTQKQMKFVKKDEILKVKKAKEAKKNA